MTDKMIDSTGDDRTVNNTMRHKYRVLTEQEKADMQTIKKLGQTFVQLCWDINNGHVQVSVPSSSRELSIARTKMEEAVMWACKHITA